MTVKDVDVVRQQTATVVQNTKCASLFISPDANLYILCPTTTVNVESFSECDLKKTDGNFNFF